jgi:hypothetical protein
MCMAYKAQADIWTWDINPPDSIYCKMFGTCNRSKSLCTLCNHGRYQDHRGRLQVSMRTSLVACPTSITQGIVTEHFNETD